MMPLQDEMPSFLGILPHQKILVVSYSNGYADFRTDYCEVRPIQTEPLRLSNKLRTISLTDIPLII